MAAKTQVSLESGSKKVFASAIDWPGWSRGARDEDAALDELVGYGPRYAAALGSVGDALVLPTDRSGLSVVEHLEGNAEFRGVDQPVRETCLVGRQALAEEDDQTAESAREVGVFGEVHGPESRVHGVTTSAVPGWPVEDP